MGLSVTSAHYALTFVSLPNPALEARGNSRSSSAVSSSSSSVITLLPGSASRNPRPGRRTSFRVRELPGPPPDISPAQKTNPSRPPSLQQIEPVRAAPRGDFCILPSEAQSRLCLTTDRCLSQFLFLASLITRFGGFLFSASHSRRGQTRSAFACPQTKRSIPDIRALLTAHPTSGRSGTRRVICPPATLSAI